MTTRDSITASLPSSLTAYAATGKANHENSEIGSEEQITRKPAQACTSQVLSNFRLAVGDVVGWLVKAVAALCCSVVSSATHMAHLNLVNPSVIRCNQTRHEEPQEPEQRQSLEEMDLQTGTLLSRIITTWTLKMICSTHSAKLRLV